MWVWRLLRVKIRLIASAAKRIFAAGKLVIGEQLRIKNLLPAHDLDDTGYIFFCIGYTGNQRNPDSEWFFGGYQAMKVFKNPFV